MTDFVRKDLKIGVHSFVLEIYTTSLGSPIKPSSLDVHQDIAWEIFPEDYSACLYAFSNKKRIENIITKQYLYEPNKKGEDAPSRV